MQASRSGPRTKVAMLDDVADELRTLADQLETLEDDDWEVPSLCQGWNVKEVVAHLTLSTRMSLREMLLPMVRARGDFDKVNGDQARAAARHSTPARLISELRDAAGVDRRFILSGRLDPLVDLLVHGQDIMRPLNRTREMPLHRVVPALEHAWKSPFVRPAKRFAEIKLTATDAEWTRGDGQLELSTSASNLLLIATGRPTGVHGLPGAAAEEVARRLAA